MGRVPGSISCTPLRADGKVAIVVILVITVQHIYLFDRKVYSTVTLLDTVTKLEANGTKRLNLTQYLYSKSYFGNMNDTYVVLRWSDEPECEGIGGYYPVPTVSLLCTISVSCLNYVNV